jgi:EmrB/QacA subfamily drug resistance transporter
MPVELQTSAGDPQVAGSPTARPMLVLSICCLSLLIIGIDSTIVTIALPTVRHGLHTSLTAAQWTVDAYQLPLGALLLLSGSTADRFGRRRILRLGLVVFTAASALCSIAPSIGWLIGLRFLQAVGASMMNPVAMAVVSHSFPDPRRRARAFGIWSGVYGLSLALGPILGGILVSAAGWRSIFWVNVPIGVLAILLVTLFVPESRARMPRASDPVGQVLTAAALGLLTFAVIEGAADGWAAPPILAAFALSTLFGVLLPVWEKRHPQPLIEFSLLRAPSLGGAVIIALAGMAAAGGYLWVMTFYLQDARDMTPLRAGLFLLPLALMVLVTAPASGRLAARYGARPPLLLSGVALAAGAGLLTGLSDTTSSTLLISSSALFGLGFGMLNAPVTAAAVAGMLPARAGVAAALASTGRQVGQALGVAIVGTVIVVGLGAAPTGIPRASHPAWWIVFGLGLTVASAALATQSRPRPPRDTLAPRVGSGAGDRRTRVT